MQPPTRLPRPLLAEHKPGVSVRCRGRTTSERRTARVWTAANDGELRVSFAAIGQTNAVQEALAGVFRLRVGVMVPMRWKQKRNGSAWTNAGESALKEVES